MGVYGGEDMGALGTENMAMGTYLQILLVVGVGGPADNIGCIQAGVAPGLCRTIGASVHLFN